MANNICGSGPVMSIGDPNVVRGERVLGWSRGRRGRPPVRWSDKLAQGGLGRAEDQAEWRSIVDIFMSSCGLQQ